MDKKEILNKLESRIIEETKKLADCTYTSKPATYIEFVSEDGEVELDLYIYCERLMDWNNTIRILRIEEGYCEVQNLDIYESNEFAEEITKELNKRLKFYEH